MAVPKNIPALLKHCTLKVYDKKGFNSFAHDGFEQAYKIARATLSRQGYLTPDSIDGSSLQIRLTGKGMARNARHVAEGRSKNANFDQMYNRFIEKEMRTAPAPRTGRVAQTTQPLERKADLRLGDDVKTAQRPKNATADVPAPRAQPPGKPRPTARPGRTAPKIPRRGVIK